MRSTLPVILYVEDHDPDAEIMSLTLEDLPVHLARVKTLTEAVRYLSSYTPAMVILDLGLPDADPKEVVSRIIAMTRSHVFVATGASLESPLVRAIESVFRASLIQKEVLSSPEGRAHVALQVAQIIGAELGIEPKRSPADTGTFRVGAWSHLYEAANTSDTERRVLEIQESLGSLIAHSDRAAEDRRNLAVEQRAHAVRISTLEQRSEWLATEQDTQRRDLKDFDKRIDALEIANKVSTEQHRTQRIEIQQSHLTKRQWLTIVAAIVTGLLGAGGLFSQCVAPQALPHSNLRGYHPQKAAATQEPTKGGE